MQNVDASAQNVVSYISPEATTGNPITQGLYSSEANPLVNCLYQLANLVLDLPPNIFSNQQNSSAQSQLLQEPLINGTCHEPISGTPELRQAMDLDFQPPQSPSFLSPNDKGKTERPFKVSFIVYCTIRSTPRYRMKLYSIPAV